MAPWPSNAYVGSTKNYIIRFSQHAYTGIGWRGLAILKNFTIPLNLTGDALRKAEQIVIQHFGGKIQLLKFVMQKQITHVLDLGVPYGKKKKDNG